MCFPFYPQDSEVNKEGEWKVVFAIKYKMIIGQITNGNYVVRRMGDRERSVRDKEE